MGEIGQRLIEVGWRSNDSQSQAVQLAADFADSYEWVAEGYSSAPQARVGAFARGGK